MSKKTRKKVLLVNKYFPPVIGGIETHVKDIADGLCRDYNIRVLVCNDNSNYKVESYNVNQVGRYQVQRIGSFGKFFSMPVSFGYFKAFRELAKKADIIHFHHPFPLGEIACFIHNTNAKVIVTWHSDILRQKFFMFFYKPFLMKFLRQADKIIVTSPNMAKNSSYLKQFQEKIEVVSLGINIKTLKHKNIKTINQIKNKFSGNKPLILSVGRLAYYKGFEYLIEAMRNIDANLLIVGSGPLEKKLKFKIRNLKLHDKVYIIDHVSDDELINFYHASDIFVLPSIAKTEAFGIVQLEAMATGKPVINTNLSTGVPWVSVNGQTGLTVPPKNPNALAKAINKLLKNNKLRLKYGRNAAERVKNLFTQEKMLWSIKKIYDNI